MLSRVDDVHVFESSEDVVGAVDSSQYLRRKPLDKLEQLEQDDDFHSVASRRLLGSSARQRVNGTISARSQASRSGSRRRGLGGASQGGDDRAEEEEDEQLHPQHPYRMRKRVLSKENVMTVDYSASRVTGPRRLDGHAKPRLGYYGAFPGDEDDESDGEAEGDDDSADESDSDSDEEEEENEDNECAVSEQRIDWKVAGRSLRGAAGRAEERAVNRQPAPRQCNERFVSSPLSSSQAGEGDKFPSDDEDSASPAPESFNSLSSDESDKDEKAAVKLNPRTPKRATASSHPRSSSRTQDKLKANGAARQKKPEQLLNVALPQEDEEDPEEDVGGHKTKRTASLRRGGGKDSVVSNAKGKEISSQRMKKQRPAPLAQASPKYQTGYPAEVQASRTKRSPKMTIRHLMTDDVKLKRGAEDTADDGKKTMREERLELKLEKEKTRVLDKMAQLLEEQGKNTQLHARIEALEVQLASRDDEASEKRKQASKEQDERAQALQNQLSDRVKTLEEQLQVKEAAVMQLERDKKQLKVAVRKLRESNGEQGTSNRSGDKEEALKQQLEDMVARVRQFLAKVERWKTSSKEAVDVCDRQADLSALMEKMWLDFPQLPGLGATEASEANRTSGRKQDEDGQNEPTNTVLFLKKRLRLREDELLQLHAKYVELKELCARQCVREADLQNFINEHRLRGNLVIRKKVGVEAKSREKSQPQDRGQGQPRRREVRTKTIANRGTNIRSSDHGEEQEELANNDEYSDNQEDNDDYGEDDDDDEDDEDDEDEEKEAYPLRAPKVFVQVSRDGVYEHSPHATSAVAEKLASERGRGRRRKELPQQEVERIRLIPSPSLTQRYERIPTPTGGAARKKRTSPASGPPRSALPECPPGCGSRLSGTRKKAVQAALRAKAPKRTVTTSAGRPGACGVTRPWM